MNLYQYILNSAKKDVGFIEKILYNKNLSVPTAPVFPREESNLLILNLIP